MDMGYEMDLRETKELMGNELSEMQKEVSQDLMQKLERAQEAGDAQRSAFYEKLANRNTVSFGYRMPEEAAGMGKLDPENDVWGRKGKPSPLAHYNRPQAQVSFGGTGYASGRSAAQWEARARELKEEHKNCDYQVKMAAEATRNGAKK